MADWNALKKQFEQEANKKLDWMLSEFDKVRTGRANPTIFYEIKVDCYGTKTPLNQLANIAASEPRKITIKPYDKTTLKAIVAEINARNMGFTPVINGDLVIINVPQPTEESRKLAVKNIKQIADKVKNEFREIRKKIQAQIKADDSISEDIIHKQEKDLNILIKEYNTKTDGLLKTKENELMTI